MTIDRRDSGGFFFPAHLALLAVVLVGFAHTFHLRPWFATRPLPAVLYLHGLIADTRLASEIESPADAENIVYWGNLVTPILFTAFVALAVVFRRRPDAHKRLTLLASISIVGPAMARFTEWPIFPGGFDARPFYGIGGLLMLFAALIVDDLVVRRRPHPASWIGAVSILVGLAAAVFLAVSGIGSMSTSKSPISAARRRCIGPGGTTKVAAGFLKQLKAHWQTR